MKDFSSGNKGTRRVKQDKDLWGKRDLILPESLKIVYNGENETRRVEILIEGNVASSK